MAPKKSERRHVRGDVPVVYRDGGRSDAAVAPALVPNPTAAEAVAVLRKFAIADATPREVGVAIAVLIDHAIQCEQALSLVEASLENAMRHAPPFSLIKR